MNPLFEDQARGSIEALKTLYAELFVMLDQTIDEPLDPDAAFPRTAALQSTMTGLMDEIGQRSRQFEELLSSELGWTSRCSDAVREEIMTFRSGLALGLRVMLDRIEARAESLSTERDRVKDDLREIQTRRKTGKAYRGRPFNPVSTLLSSEA